MGLSWIKCSVPRSRGGVVKSTSRSRPQDRPTMVERLPVFVVCGLSAADFRRFKEHDFSRGVGVFIFCFFILETDGMKVLRKKAARVSPANHTLPFSGRKRARPEVLRDFFLSHPTGVRGRSRAVRVTHTWWLCAVLTSPHPIPLSPSLFNHRALRSVAFRALLPPTAAHIICQAMWSSQATPVLTPPSHSWILPEPSPMEPSCPSFKALGSVESEGCRVDKIVMERVEAAEPPQRQQQQPVRRQHQQQQRGRTAGKKRAVFGGVRQLLLSRSRSASRERPRSVPRERSFSSAPLPDDDKNFCDDTTAVIADESRFQTAPAPRRLFSSRHRRVQAAEAEETEGGAERPRSDRMGREENFHAAMENKQVHEAFAAFCKKTLAWENIEFVLQVGFVECM